MKEQLLNLMKNAYANYSNFPVAAIVVTKDNKEFYGINVEDASYRAGACAERVALFSMLTSGYTKGDVKEINVMTSSKNIGTPCFVCRQMILELCDLDTKINCYSMTGDLKSYTVKELCPYPFCSDDLNR